MKFAKVMLFAVCSLSAVKADTVDDLFEVMDMQKQLTGGFEAMMPMIEQQAAQLQLDAEGKKELQAIFKTWFETDIDQEGMVNQMKQLYRDSFTDEELTEVIAFYNTAVGQKFIKQSPALMQEGARIGMLEAQNAQGKLMERLAPFFEKVQK